MISQLDLFSTGTVVAESKTNFLLALIYNKMIYFIQHKDKKITNLSTKKEYWVNIFSKINLLSVLSLSFHKAEPILLLLFDKWKSES